jgi:CMD domain protein
MPAPEADVIDTVVGIAPGSRLDLLRARRPEARLNAQASHAALFTPETPGDFTVQERFVLARFIVGLHGPSALADFYAARLKAAGASPELAAAIEAEITAGTTTGPYGHYPAGPLSAEDTSGPAYAVEPEACGVIGARLAAGLEHAHMLVFHPRDAASPMLQKLLDVGWSNTEIVTLSQLAAFLSFQVRVVSGLRTLAAQPQTGEASP